MVTTIESILEYHGLRITTPRKTVLKLFFETHSTLTAQEVQKKIGNSCNKATVYRALDAFEKNGLIYKVPNNGSSILYALCQEIISQSHNSVHNHAHFICNSCKKTFCINDIQPPKIESINGFRIKSTKLTLEGECPECSSIKRT